MVRSASAYERELKDLLQGESSAVTRYARGLPPDRRPGIAPAHGSAVPRDPRGGVARVRPYRPSQRARVPARSEGLPSDTIRFSSASGRAATQLAAHRAAVERVGLLCTLCVSPRRPSRRRDLAIVRSRSPSPRRTAGRSTLARLPPVDATAQGNAVLRWADGMPLSEFLEKLEFLTTRPGRAGPVTVVTVASWGLTLWGDRAEGLVDLLAEAGSVALEGVGRKPIDLLIVGSTGIGESADGSLVLPQVSDRLGIDTGAAVRVESGTATGAAAFHSAVEAVRSGDVEEVLVVAAEKRPPAARDPTSAWMEPWLAPSERAAGATAPALAALIAQRYMTRFATGPEVFDEIVTRARERASPSPRDPKPAGDPGRALEQSPWVAPPLRAAHCAVRGDGAAAIVVERGAGRVIVRGIGQGLDVQAVSERADLTSFRASRWPVSVPWRAPDSPAHERTSSRSTMLTLRWYAWPSRTSACANRGKPPRGLGTTTVLRRTHAA